MELIIIIGVMIDLNLASRHPTPPRQQTQAGAMTVDWVTAYCISRLAYWLLLAQGVVAVTGDP